MNKDGIQFAKETPGSLREKTASLVRFRISEEMVRRFEELTGDHSLLHSSGDFARRSAYRRQVVHGMLPIAFITLLDFFRRDGLICVPVELNGQFINPVYQGDELSLHGEIIDNHREDALVTCAYSAEKAMTGVSVAKGTIKVRHLPCEKRPGRAQLSHRAPSLLTESPGLRELKLEEISVKDADGFRFIVSEEAVNAFLEILSAGIAEENRFALSAARERVFFPTFLSIMLFSTSVGMCIPGKYATFLGFDASIDKQVDSGIPYILKGAVAHISGSTRIIKKDVAILRADEGGDPHLTGKVSILVNAPPVKMPTIMELKKSALDAGLRDRVVLITGASRGIGETTAKVFALLGAKVIVNYFRGKEDAEKIVAEIRDEGCEAFSAGADVSDPAQVREMVQRAVERYGTIHVLVNSAVRDFRPVDFLKLAWEDLQGDLDVVVRGAFNCCKEVIPLMLKQGGGKIINIGTVATDNPPPHQLKYVVAKSGLLGLTRSLSVEFASRNIQVNMVAPNFVETDLVAHIPGVHRKKIAQDTPMRRNASPAEVAQAVVFLASSHSSFTTGQKILVTGGGAPYL